MPGPGIRSMYPVEKMLHRTGHHPMGKYEPAILHFLPLGFHWLRNNSSARILAVSNLGLIGMKTLFT